MNYLEEKGIKYIKLIGQYQDILRAHRNGKSNEWFEGKCVILLNEANIEYIQELMQEIAQKEGI